MLGARLEHLGPEPVGLLESPGHRQHVHEVVGREGLHGSVPPPPGEGQSRLAVLFGPWEVVDHAKVRQIALREHLDPGETIASGHREAALEVQAGFLDASVSEQEGSLGIERPGERLDELVVLGEPESLLDRLDSLLRVAGRQERAAPSLCSSSATTEGGAVSGSREARASRSSSYRLFTPAERVDQRPRAESVTRAASTIRPAALWAATAASKWPRARSWKPVSWATRPAFSVRSACSASSALSSAAVR